MNNSDIHIVGLGNLGTAFFEGLYSFIDESSIVLYDESEDRINFFQSNFELSVKTKIEKITTGVLILCIKPQNISSFFELNKSNISSDVLICSPVAGLEIDQISTNFKNNIIRVMPNLLIRQNNGFIPFSKNYEDDYLGFEKNVLQKLGSIRQFEEKDFPVLTALSGSGPAWYYELSKNLVSAGVDLGLSENDADFIIKELVNALPNLINTSDSFETLVNKVKSPKGTTEAGINSLIEDSFDKIIKNAIQKSANRSNEISEELKRE